MRKINPKIDKHYIIGSGGGKGGSSRTPTEAANNLRSTATYRILEAISEGEIGGLVLGLKGVYLDATPVQNTDGSYNFEGVNFETREGLPDQEYVEGFPTSESIVAVNTEVPDDQGIIRTVVGGNSIDAGRVVIRLPNGLSAFDEETGDLNGWRLGVAVDVRPNSSAAWQNAINDTIVGKTMRPYEKAYRVERPASSTDWQIRVRRTTQPEDKARISDRLDWFIYTQIVDEKVTYPDVAVAGIAFSAESTGGNIPTRSYLVDGLKIQVPTNYIPPQYNDNDEIVGLPLFTNPNNWNGTFKTDECNDPALICLDLITNDRYGLGEFVDISEVDIYSFYEAAVYNTERVDAFTDGVDSPPYPSRFISRFTCDTTIQTREDAWQAIQSIAATCRGSVINSNGIIKFIQDRPSEPVSTITREKVVNGDINYSSTDLNSRFTSCNVVYNERKNRYLPTIVNERLTNDWIGRYGYNEVELQLVGCTNEWQARRMARWALYSSTRETQKCEFSVSYEHAFLSVNDIVLVADTEMAQLDFAGTVTLSQINPSDPNEVTITTDRTLSYAQFFNRDIRLYDNFGGFVTATISSWIGENAEGETVLRLNIANGSLRSDYKYSSYAFLQPVEPRPFRVDGISEEEEGIWRISCSEHDPSKYNYIDFGIELDTPDFYGDGGYVIPRPSGLTIDVESVITPSSTIRFRIRMNWNDVDDEFLYHYRVKWRRNNGQWTLSDRIMQSEYLIDDALPGFYEFEIMAVSSRNIYSAPLRGSSYVDVSGEASPIGAITNLRLVGGGTTFNDTNFTIEWNKPSGIEFLDEVSLKGYHVRLIDNTTDKNALKIFFVENLSDTVTHNITRAHVEEAYGRVPRNIPIEVLAVDNLNRVSDDSLTNTFTNPAPFSVTNLSVEALDRSYKIKHDLNNGDDVEGYKIFHSTSSGFSPGPSNLVKDDVGNEHIVEGDYGVTYFIKVAAYDTWSRDSSELNFSAQTSVEMNFRPVEDIDPEQPLIPSTSSDIVTLINGTQVANISITWGKVSNVNAYDVEIFKDGTLWGIPIVTQPDTGTTVSYQLNGDIGSTYCFRIRSRYGNNISAWSAQRCLTQSADSTSPTVPTGISTSPRYQGALIKWSNPSSANFEACEVWRRESGNTTSGEQVGTISRPTYFMFDGGLDLDTTYEYRVRAVSFEGVYSNYSGWSSVTPLNVPPDSIDASHIVANTITATELASNIITSEHIQSGTLVITDTAQLGDAIITNAKIQGDLYSDNFLTGVQGWKLWRAGSAEFGDVSIRGDLKTGINPDYRVEITRPSGAGDYIIWAGSGAKTDANSVFFVKANGESEYSGPISGGVDEDDINPNPPPPIPTGVSIYDRLITMPGGSQTGELVCSWNSVTGANRYEIEIRNGGTSGTIEGIHMVGDQGSYVFRGDIGKTYTIRVRSISPLGVKSGWSASASSFVAQDGTSPGNIGTSLSVTGGYQSIVLNWDNPSSQNISYIQIQRKSGLYGSFATIAEVSKPQNHYIDSNLNIGSTYYYRVRAVSNSGVTGLWSSERGAVSQNVPSLSITSTQIGNNSISTAKIQSNAITANEISSGVITGDLIAANTITGNNISANTITGDLIQGGTITANELEAGLLTVTSADIADFIQSDNYVSGSTGWRINRSNGEAEFGEATIRGSLRAGSGTDTRVSITPTGPNRIWIGNGTSNALFVVDALGNVTMNDATANRLVIKNNAGQTVMDASGELNGAFIEDLSVNTLKIASNAITLGRSLSASKTGSTSSSTGSSYTVDTSPLASTESISVIVIATASAYPTTGSTGSVTLSILKNGSSQASSTSSVVGYGVAIAVSSIISVKDGDTIALRITSSGGGVTTDTYANGSIFAGKR